MHLPAFASAVPSPVFRDRKRRGWLLSVVAPGLATIGPLAHTLGASSLWWFAAPLVLFYGALPLADWLLARAERAGGAARHGRRGLQR